MLTVLEVTLPVFGLVICGFIGSWLRMLPDKAVDGINAFVFWFALPAMLFRVIGLQPVAQLVEPHFVLAWVCAGLSVFFTVAWLAMAGGVDRADRSAGQSTAFALTAAHGNVGYLGLGLVAELGKQWLPTIALAILCDIFVIITLGLILLELQTKPGPTHVWAIVRKIASGLLKSPLVVSICVGLLFSLSELRLPVAIDNFSRILGNAAGPCALFAIGASLGGQTVSTDRAVWVLCLFKLLVHPLMAALYLFVVFKLPPDIAAIGVIAAALPAASNTFIISQRYGMKTLSISSSILLGTFVAIVTVSATVWLLGLQPDYRP